MYVTHVATQQPRNIVIEEMQNSDYRKVKRTNFDFNWGLEKANQVFKLRIEDQDEILGLISLIHFPDEQRIEIHLLAASKENIGHNKIYERIAGNLIAFACRECLKYYSHLSCVSLIPKTVLRQHYVDEYGMTDDGGKHLFFEGTNLYNMINNFEI